MIKSCDQSSEDLKKIYSLIIVIVILYIFKKDFIYKNKCHLYFIGAVGGEGGDEDDKEKEEEAERERQEAIREAEERRKEKHRKMEEEREKMRQEIRDKVNNDNYVVILSLKVQFFFNLPLYKRA